MLCPGAVAKFPRSQLRLSTVLRAVLRPRERSKETRESFNSEPVLAKQSISILDPRDRTLPANPSAFAPATSRDPFIFINSPESQASTVSRVLSPPRS